MLHAINFKSPNIRSVLVGFQFIEMQFDRVKNHFVESREKFKLSKVQKKNFIIYHN